MWKIDANMSEMNHPTVRCGRLRDSPENHVLPAHPLPGTERAADPRKFLRTCRPMFPRGETFTGFPDISGPLPRIPAIS